MRRSLWQSFEFAGKGLQTAFRSQRTMRVHVTLAAAVAVASMWVGLSASEAALLILAVGAVLAAELMNTAVEVIVDLQVGHHRHELAGRAKDLAAAGVLVSAASAALIGLVMLGPPVVAALRMGQLDAMAAGRAGTLLAVLALVAVVLRRTGERTVREARLR